MSLSAIFSFKKRTLNLTEPTTTLKGQYLGNVSTNVAKGEKCTDRPLSLLWSNYVKTTGKQTVAMKITVDNSGLKVYTTSQGLTHYWCHRISHFCVAATTNPKLFVWIYRHVGKKLKVELRCHAIHLASEKKAKDLVDLLTDKVAASLQEYRREKTLKHRRRLLDQKAEAHLTHHGESRGQARTKLLATSKNYKPPTEYSLASPTLTAISEEADCSSSEESDYNAGSPYSTLGRWTFRNKFNKSVDTPTTPDVNMNQLADDRECDDDPLIDYSDVSGFATLPRRQRHSNRKSQKRLLVDRLETLVMQTAAPSPPTLRGHADNAEVSDGSKVGCEVESGSDDEDGDSGAGSQSLSGAEASPVIPRFAAANEAVHRKQSHDNSSSCENVNGEGGCEDPSLFDADTEQNLLQRRAPSIAHIRSFSDGFYSFDKSSISSDCSDASSDRPRVGPQSANLSSCESGVGGECCAGGGIDSLESTLYDNGVKLERIDRWAAAAADDTSVSSSQSVHEDAATTATSQNNNLAGIRSPYPTNTARQPDITELHNICLNDVPDAVKLPQLNGDITHITSKNLRSNLQGGGKCYNDDNIGALSFHGQRPTERGHDSDSDCSDDSSIQIIRIITRL